MKAIVINVVVRMTYAYPLIKDCFPAKKIRRLFFTFLLPVMVCFPKQQRPVGRFATTEDNLPLNGDKRFVGIENGLDPDYYLWLTGQATRWFHGESGFSTIKPAR